MTVPRNTDVLRGRGPGRLPDKDEVHVPQPAPVTERRVTRPLRLARAVLASTGWYATVPVLGLAVLLTVAFPDGRISYFGPLELNPELRVLVAVPLLMAVAVGIAQSATPSPIVFRNGRVVVVRAVCYALTLLVSWGIVLLGSELGTGLPLAACLRNLLLMSGICAATGALAGPAYVFIPAVIALAAGMVTPGESSEWAPWSMSFRETASTEQLVVAAVVAVIGLALAVWDPRSVGYLRRARRSGR